MLYWATKPDSFFAKIVDEALRLGCHRAIAPKCASVDGWRSQYPRLSISFRPTECLTEIKKLLLANGMEKVLRLVDRCRREMTVYSWQGSQWAARVVRESEMFTTPILPGVKLALKRLLGIADRHLGPDETPTPAES